MFWDVFPRKKNTLIPLCLSEIMCCTKDTTNVSGLISSACGLYNIRSKLPKLFTFSILPRLYAKMQFSLNITRILFLDKEEGWLLQAVRWSQKIPFFTNRERYYKAQRIEHNISSLGYDNRFLMNYTLLTNHRNDNPMSSKFIIENRNSLILRVCICLFLVYITSPRQVFILSRI